MALLISLAFPIISHGASLNTLMGTVYVDLNQDGAFATGDWGVRNAVIQLYDQSGNFLEQTTTDSQGRYTFDGLLDGLYTIKNTTFSSLGAAVNVGQIVDKNGHVVPDVSMPNSALMEISNIDLTHDGSTAAGFNFGNDQYPMQLYSKYLLVADPIHQIQYGVVTPVPEPTLGILLGVMAAMAGAFACWQRRSASR